MTQLATRDQNITKFKEFFARPTVLAEFGRAIRSGHNIDAQAVARIALTTLSDPKSPKLLECDERSVCASIVTALALGLEPDNVSGMAYLVPYGKTCTLIVGYRGMIQLAWRSGQIKGWATYNVYAHEPFDRDTGRLQEIQHTPLPPSKRGEYIGSYTKVTFIAGGVHYEWMWREEIDAICKRSAAGAKGPWSTDTDEMRRKTVDKRAFKRIPSSPTLQRAVALDDQAQSGQAQSLEIVDVDPTSGPQDAPPAKPSLDDYTDKKPPNGNGPGGEPAVGVDSPNPVG